MSKQGLLFCANLPIVNFHHRSQSYCFFSSVVGLSVEAAQDSHGGGRLTSDFKYCSHGGQRLEVVRREYAIIRGRSVFGRGTSMRKAGRGFGLLDKYRGGQCCTGE